MLCCGGNSTPDDVSVGGSTSKLPSDFKPGDKFAVMAGRWDIEKDPIGEGGFGTVHLCRPRGKTTSKQRALKAMRLKAPEEWEDFRNEVAIMRRLKRHHNIVHMIDAAQDKKFGYIVMQACTGGELFDRIASRSGGLSERDAAMAVVDVVRAIDHFHAKRVIHRDLKPENLLYKDSDPGSPLKVIDFGLAIIQEPGQKVDECCGTTSYMAPEVLTGAYSTEVDLWSLGVIVFFMLSGYLPFPGRSDEEKEEKILRGQYSMGGKAWTKVSKEAKDFITKLLAQVPSKRMTGHDALKHPWITNRANLSEMPLDAEVAAHLKHYAANHRFERAVRHSMATHLTSVDLHRLRTRFESLDTEGGGVLTTADLKKVMSESGNTDAEVAELMKKIDLDNDGEIDWKEFVAAMMCEHTLFNEENLEKVFKSIDTDGSGALCQKEIAGLLGDDSELAREILEDLKKERGEDPSNDVSEIRMTLDEFKALLSSQYRGKAALLSPRSRKRHTKRAPDGTRTPREQKV